MTYLKGTTLCGANFAHPISERNEARMVALYLPQLKAGMMGFKFKLLSKPFIHNLLVLPSHKRTFIICTMQKAPHQRLGEEQPPYANRLLMRANLKFFSRGVPR